MIQSKNKHEILNCHLNNIWITNCKCWNKTWRSVIVWIIWKIMLSAFDNWMMSHKTIIVILQMKLIDILSINRWHNFQLSIILYFQFFFQTATFFSSQQWPLCTKVHLNKKMLTMVDWLYLFRENYSISSILVMFTIDLALFCGHLWKVRLTEPSFLNWIKYNELPSSQIV